MKKPRAYIAGFQVAEALTDTAKILYLKDDRIQYLRGIMNKIKNELKVVLKNDSKDGIQNRKEGAI